MTDPTLVVYVRCNAPDKASPTGICGAEMTPLNAAMDGTEVVLPGISADTGRGHCENCGAELQLTPAVLAAAILELLKRLTVADKAGEVSEETQDRITAINNVQHGCLVALGEA